MLHGSVNGHHHIGLTPVLAPMWLARSKRLAREYWTSRPATKSMAAPAHPTDCRSPINSNSTPTFWLSSRAEPGNQHRRIFDAVARTASSLKRDRRFADSPLEGAVRCELVSAAGPTPPIKGSFIRRSDEFLESIKKG